MGMKTIIVISTATLLLAACKAPQVQDNAVQQVQDTQLEQIGTQKVQLIWKQAENKWMVKLNGGPEKDPATAKTTLAKDSGPAMFIVDITGNSATFKDPGGLTVWEGSKSNPQGSAQIFGPVITTNGKLVFWDLNQGNQVSLFYSLNLNDGTSIDPIIENGGGTWSP
jgi:hypothetical protein